MRGKVWPRETVEKLRALIHNGTSVKKAADQIGIAYHQARSICGNNNIALPGHRPALDVDELRRLAAERLTAPEISERLRVTATTVWKYANKYEICITSANQGNTTIQNAERRILSVRAPSTAEPAAAAAAPGTPYGLTDIDRAALSSTGGRYRDLRKWADERGMTVMQAQQRWHALGLPVGNGGVA